MTETKPIHDWLAEYRHHTPGVYSLEDIVAEELEKHCKESLRLSRAQWELCKEMIERVAKHDYSNELPDIRPIVMAIAEGLNVFA